MRRLKKIENFEIEGYKIRAKCFPAYDKAEPDVAFYAKLEEKKILQNTIGQLAVSEDSEIFSDKENIMNIATNYYKELYTPNKVNTKTQDKLLRKI